jgi:sugar lactone lactonase YvrE
MKNRFKSHRRVCNFTGCGLKPFRLTSLLLAGSLSLAPALHAQNLPTFIFTTLAGNSGYGSVNGPGTNASFYTPQGIAADASNNVYVADSQNNLIRKISPTGVVSTFAGTAGVAGFSNAVGTAAQFNFPSGVALDSSNNLYVADTVNCVIRKITPAGVVSTFVGIPGSAGSTDSSAGTPQFSYPDGVAVDGSNNIYVADSGNNTVRFVTSAGVVSTLAGTPGNFGDADGTGTNAAFSVPYGITVDGSYNVYVADIYNNTIRKITQGGVVSTFAGMKGVASSEDGTGTNASFAQPFGVTWDGGGNLFVADSENNILRKIVIATAQVSTYASGPGRSNPGHADGTGSAASFYGPEGIAVSSSGTAFVADTGNNLIRQMTTGGSVGTVTTLAGIASTGTNDGLGASARFNSPWGLAVDSSNNVFVADSGNNTIRKIDTNGNVTTFAGVPGVFGHADTSNGPATFFAPRGIAIDSSNNVFVAELFNDTIRKITPAGVVTTFAGLAFASGTNNGVGSAARFSGPSGLAVDASNNIYVADSFNNLIRFITPAGLVSTFAGTGTRGTNNGDALTQAEFANPSAVAVDPSNNVYVADTGNNAIRIITGDPVVNDKTFGEYIYNNYGLIYWVSSKVPGIEQAAAILVTCFSGMDVVAVEGDPIQVLLAGTPQVQGDANGPGASALFNGPVGIAEDSLGRIYIADNINNEIRLGTSCYGPVISNITLIGGGSQINAGSQISINGSGLSSETGVTFAGGVSAGSVTINSDSQLTVVVPSGAATGLVTVSNPCGSTSSPLPIVVGAPPSLSLGLGATPVSGGALNIVVTAPGGLNYKVQSSADLVHWTTISTLTTTGSQTSTTVPIQSPGSMFIRVVLQTNPF